MSPGMLAQEVADTCGLGRVLAIGDDTGALVAGLLARGLEARGMDLPASLLALPFPDAHADTVVATDGLAQLAPADVPAALRDIRRVSARYVVLQVATTHESERHLTVEGRAWWEQRCCEAGFRKHPLYYAANPYAALNADGAQILVLLEKVPDAALRRYDLAALPEERLLHTDMLRETGRRSDAHCIRYHEAAAFVRPGDRVLDVACGLGYGSHILYARSQAASVLGVDLSDFGIAYAQAHYGRPGAVEFRVGDAQALDGIADHSVDFIAAFETIEHVPDPMAYLRALRRVLKPAGRVMVCAPNDWTDETGRDPNPHHLHVYTWDRLVAEVGAHFVLEQGFLQTAGGALKCHHAERRWQAVPADRAPAQESEWVLLLGMADPAGAEAAAVPYRETAWALPDDARFHVAAFGRDYANPWLVRGMVAIGMRLAAPAPLEALQRRVLEQAAPSSVDHGAALCGQVYARMAQPALPAEEREALEAEIRRYAAIPQPAPHVLRWQVSLLYAGGELARRQGRLDDARAFFADCVRRDVGAYSPLLGNKQLDALHWLAGMALARADRDAARGHLQQSVALARRLVSGSWLNIVGSDHAPLPFGLAEAAQLLDKASRAAYALSVLDTQAGRPGLAYQQAQGFFERQLAERDRRLAAAEAAQLALRGALDAQRHATQQAQDAAQAQHANAQAQAREVARLDAHAQALGREVAARDADAQRFARELVQERAASSAARRDAELASLREQLAQAQHTIARQDAWLAVVRPHTWPARLRALIRKSRP